MKPALYLATSFKSWNPCADQWNFNAKGNVFDFLATDKKWLFQCEIGINWKISFQTWDQNWIYSRQRWTHLRQVFHADAFLSPEFMHESCSMTNINEAIRKPFLANQFGWFKAENYQVHGVVCETSIIAQTSVQACEIQRKFQNWFQKIFFSNFFQFKTLI